MELNFSNSLLDSFIPFLTMPLLVVDHTHQMTSHYHDIAHHHGPIVCHPAPSHSHAPPPIICHPGIPSHNHGGCFPMPHPLVVKVDPVTHNVTPIHTDQPNDHTMHIMPIDTTPGGKINHTLAINTPVSKAVTASGHWSASTGFQAQGGGCVTTPHHEVCVGGHVGNSWGVTVGGSHTQGNTTIGASMSGGPHGVNGGMITGSVRW